MSIQLQKISYTDLEDIEIDKNGSSLTELNSSEIDVKDRSSEKVKSIVLKPSWEILCNKETLSDVDENFIEELKLTPDESTVKSILWHHIHKDWVEEQSYKDQTAMKIKENTKKRKRKVRELIDAPNPIIAISRSSKLANKLDMDQLSSMFEESIVKKLKIE